MPETETAADVPVTVPVSVTVGCYIYPNMTMLDILGPHQTLGFAPGFKAFTFARTTEPIVTDTGLRIVPDYGFDDVPQAALATPPLTTVSQPHRRKGSEAVRLLLDGDEQSGIELPVELIVRASTAPSP